MGVGAEGNVGETSWCLSLVLGSRISSKLGQAVMQMCPVSHKCIGTAPGSVEVGGMDYFAEM